MSTKHICNWCGMKLHDRYHIDIRYDKEGNAYCSTYCLETKETNDDKASFHASFLTPTSKFSQ